MFVLSKPSSIVAKVPPVRKNVLAAVAACTAAVGVILGVFNLDRVGDLYMNQGDYAHAIPYYQIMTQANSALGRSSGRLADAWTNLGICYGKVGKLDAAIEVQKIALDVRKDQAPHTVP